MTQPNSDSHTTADRKQTAMNFMRLLVGGRIDEAFRTHVDLGGRHHNPFFPAGFPALQQAMEESQEQFPSKQLTIHHVIGDGDLVAVHAGIELQAGMDAVTVVHIYRFQHDKIVEMWDCSQPVPDDSPNADGAF